MLVISLWSTGIHLVYDMWLNHAAAVIPKSPNGFTLSPRNVTQIKQSGGEKEGSTTHQSINVRNRQTLWVYEHECGYLRPHLWTLLYPPASAAWRRTGRPTSNCNRGVKMTSSPYNAHRWGMAPWGVGGICKEGRESAKAKTLKKWGQFQLQIPDNLLKISLVQVNHLATKKDGDPALPGVYRLSVGEPMMASGWSYMLTSEMDVWPLGDNDPPIMSLTTSILSTTLLSI